MINILVCLSRVPDTVSKLQFSEDYTDFDTTGVQFIINPHDEFGLTRALQLKETIGAKVTAICVGMEPVESILRRALAVGVDHAIRIDAKPLDALFVSKQIAQVVNANSYDCIITGKESIDYNGGSVAAMLSAILCVSYVNNCISLDFEENKAICKREINGQKETLSATLPLVVSTQKGIVLEKDLKIPNMRGIMQARQKNIEVKNFVECVSTQFLKKYEPLPEKQPVKLINPDSIDDLISVLDKEGGIFK